MKAAKKFFLLAAFFLMMPVVAYGAGAHDALKCTGCHSMHDAKGDVIFAVKPNTGTNPDTKQPYEGVTSLCLGCHETSEHGGFGILPISAHKSHPFGVVPNPRIAKVPAELLRNGRLECVSCHEPHPSNSNYKYLRVDTKKLGMETFCAVCHPDRTDASTKDVKIFGFDKGEQGPAQGAAPKPKAAPKAKTTK
ncbi:MAG: hypothetical protein M0Z59_10035 [Nitrospiraceae bacterium]|nr:hypothetical protein [Nitrospiraceae bacterium]